MRATTTVRDLTRLNSEVFTIPGALKGGMQVGGREEDKDKDKDKDKDNGKGKGKGKGKVKGQGKRLSSIAVVVPQSSRTGAGARSDKAPKTQFDVCLVDNYCPTDSHDSTAQRRTRDTSSGGKHRHLHLLAVKTNRDRKRFRSGYGVSHRRGVRLTVYAWADLLGMARLCPGSVVVLSGYELSTNKITSRPEVWLGRDRDRESSLHWLHDGTSFRAFEEANLKAVASRLHARVQAAVEWWRDSDYGPWNPGRSHSYLDDDIHGPSSPLQRPHTTHPTHVSQEGYTHGGYCAVVLDNQMQPPSHLDLGALMALFAANESGRGGCVGYKVLCGRRFVVKGVCLRRGFPAGTTPAQLLTHRRPREHLLPGDGTSVGARAATAAGLRRDSSAVLYRAWEWELGLWTSPIAASAAASGASPVPVPVLVPVPMPVPVPVPVSMPVRVLVEAGAVQRLLVGLPAEVIYLATQEEKERCNRTKGANANTDTGSGTGTDFPRSTGPEAASTLHKYLSWTEDIVAALEQLQTRGEEVQLVLRVMAPGPDEHATGPEDQDQDQDQGQVRHAVPRLVLEELYSATLEVVDDY